MPKRSAADTYPGVVAIRRAVDTARACGIDVGGVEVSKDGSIRVIDARCLAAAANAPVDEYAQLKARGLL